MGTGLFTHRSHNQGRAFTVHKARQAQARRRALNDFADGLANGSTVASAAAAIGQTYSWGEHALREIRRGLGWQAK
jgi:hypothetical protein